MAKRTPPPPVPATPRGAAAPGDQPARDRIEREFHRNFLVEAGAGSGKTHSLARRMAAGIAAGAWQVEHMAAVTFTRKAAAELRARFQMALEEWVGAGPAGPGGVPLRAPTPPERARAETALRSIERLFAGTIHAFCARLLRERPVEARIAPGFVELDEVEDLRRRKQAWRDYVARARALASPVMLELQRAGVRPQELDRAFAVVCEHQDVDFPAGDGARPDVDAAWDALDAFWRKLVKLVPATPDPEQKCPALHLADEFGGRFDYARRWKRQPATLAEFLNDWKRARVTQKWWDGAGAEAKALVDAFRADTAEPFVAAWRRYVYRLAITLLVDARAFYAEQRRRANVVNYVDLLAITARLLRQDPRVCRALRQKYRWFFIDEFQDTDPIQAEIFLRLAADPPDDERHTTSPDPFMAGLRPGALFVVGDPKQSIYRFRRADIDIYNRVRDRIAATGGELLHLTSNWRSLPGVCALANTVFSGLLPATATRESPAFERLDPQRPESDAPPGPRVVRLVVPADVDKKNAAAWEADRVARYIRSEVAANRRRFGSFLILTRYRPRLAVFAEALDRLGIPLEVSGAGRFGGSEQVEALSVLLASLADPLDGAALGGVLRGPLFGLSDPDLHAFRVAGGRFELTAPLVAADADRLVEVERGGERAARLADELDRRFGPVLPAIRRLREWRHLLRRLPIPAAVDHLLDDSGWLALAATSAGGARAGDLLQAVDYVRQVVESGGGLAQAAAALIEDDDVATEVETLPLEPGRRDVVRLMNLHKAKGLEADVVFLADPAHGKPFGVDVRIVRESERAVGYLKVERAPEGKPWRMVLGEPQDWDEHARREQAYRDAEITRLLYVAATRARDLLVVGQWAAPTSKGAAQNEAWGAFDSFLATAEILPEPVDVPAVPPPLHHVSREAREQAARRRDGEHRNARQATWEVWPVTREHAVLRTRAARVREAMDGIEAGGAPAPTADQPLEAAPGLAFDTAGARADAGAAWGSLIHGLLEHAMRHRQATRADLERLARWLTVETPDLRPLIAGALDVVEGVARARFWSEASTREHHIEVPFALMVPDGRDEGRAGEGGGTSGLPRLVRGVIDLVYRLDGGWRIVDYKTDRTDEAAALAERHAAQLGAYVSAWTRLSGEGDIRAGVYGIRKGAMEWVEPPPAPGA